MNFISLALSTAALLAGLWVYVACRGEDICVNVLLARLLPAGALHAWREEVSAVLPVPDAVAWRLPGGLWVFAATLLARDLSVTVAKARVEMASLPVLTALSLEGCQACHLTDGAYDSWDVVTVIGAAVLAWMLPGCGWPPHELSRGWHWRGAVCAGSFAILMLADVHR